MAARADRVEFTVYSRNYCHLCDALIAGLRGLQADFRFRFEIVDIDSDPKLEQRFGERVPVLVHAGQELCHYCLDIAAVTALLTKIR
jgi:thioredoxin-like negative regulator of GroEL